LGVTEGGAKFRLAEGHEASQPHSHRHAILVSIIAATLLIGALIVALLLFLRARPPVIQPTPNVAAAAVPTLATAIDAATEDPSEVVTKSDVQRQPENAIVKPYWRPWRFRPPAKTSPYPASKVAAELPEGLLIVRLRDFRLDPTRGASYAIALRDELRKTPEVALQEPLPKKATKEDAEQRIEELMRKIRDANIKQKKSDAFVRGLIEKRGDLAGLPFQLDTACRLDEPAATQLSGASAVVRYAVECNSKRGTLAIVEPRVVDAFWKEWTGNRALAGSRSPATRSAIASDNPSAANSPEHVAAGVAALTQILAAEDAAVRKSLMKNLSEIEHASAGKALVKFALYDFDDAVRSAAIEGLKGRSSAEYLPQLLSAFRYPWPFPSGNAAEALIRLGMVEAMPALIDFLDEPDPAAPFSVERQGKSAVAMRELVRVNHHRNCQLCHAPADGRNTNTVLGLVPNAAQPLPPFASRVYYSSSRNADLIVRADTTYLRQDFSVLLPVEDSGTWPEMQRFDFLVRRRVLTEKEAKESANSSNANVWSVQHEAALTVLRQLTGQDHGTTAEAWRRVCVSVPGILGTSKPGFTQ
jgi:hypothetical protein